MCKLGRNLHKSSPPGWMRADSIVSGRPRAASAGAEARAGSWSRARRSALDPDRSCLPKALAPRSSAPCPSQNGAGTGPSVASRTSCAVHPPALVVEIVVELEQAALLEGPAKLGAGAGKPRSELGIVAAVRLADASARRQLDRVTRGHAPADPVGDDQSLDLRQRTGYHRNLGGDVLEQLVR